MRNYREMYLVTKEEYSRIKKMPRSINKPQPLDVKTCIRSLKAVTNRAIKKNTIKRYKVYG